MPSADRGFTLWGKCCILLMTLVFTLMHDGCGSEQCECVMILHWQGSQPIRDRSIATGLSLSLSVCIDQLGCASEPHSSDCVNTKIKRYKKKKSNQYVMGRTLQSVSQRPTCKNIALFQGSFRDNSFLFFLNFPRLKKKMSIFSCL